MARLTIALPSQAAQTALNLRRWEELLADHELEKAEGRIETDRHGHIIMSPPPAATRGRLQAEIAHVLRSLMKNGRVLTECLISTADGVKAADVAWASPRCLRVLGKQVCFPNAPEICVEVLLQGNTAAEMEEKRVLYFDAGAKEVWVCEQPGAMSFQGRKPGGILKASQLCPEFPKRIELR